MKDKEQKDLIAELTDSLSALTANQATIIELLYAKLTDLSDAENATLEGCAKKNYRIAENLQATVKKVRGS